MQTLGAIYQRVFGQPVQTGGNAVANAVLDTVTQEEMVRNRRFADLWRAYDGALDDPLKVTKSDPKGKDNLKLNYASLVVDIGVAFLFGKLVDFTVNGQADSPEEKLLDLCWAQNSLMPTLLEIGINGGVTGHAFVRLLEPDKDEQQKYPQVVVLDPSNVTPVCAPDNYKKVIGWKLQWTAVDPFTGKPVVYRQRIQRDGAQWHITDERSIGGKGVFETVQETPWPYAWSPIHHCQNLPAPNAFWGRSDLEDVVAVNEGINFSVSNTRRIERIHGHPLTYVRGQAATSLDRAIDGTLFLTNPQAEVKNLEMQSDLTASATWYQIIKSSLHEITRIPECATGKVDNLGALSGVALQTLFQPLLQKTETKRVLYGPLLQSLNAHLLEMMTKQVANVENVWPDLLPKSDKEEADTALVDEQLGASKRTLLTKRGYDPDAEETQRNKEAQTAQQMGADLLSQFEKGQLGGQGTGGGNGKSAGTDNGNAD